MDSPLDMGLIYAAAGLLVGGWMLLARDAIHGSAARFTELRTRGKLAEARVASVRVIEGGKAWSRYSLRVIQVVFVADDETPMCVESGVGGFAPGSIPRVGELHPIRYLSSDMARLNAQTQAGGLLEVLCFTRYAVPARTRTILFEDEIGSGASEIAEAVPPVGAALAGLLATVGIIMTTVSLVSAQ